MISSNTNVLKVKLVNKLAKLPVRGSEYSAGYDIYLPSNEDDKHEIAVPCSTSRINDSLLVEVYDMGIQIEPPKGYWYMLVLRSSMIKSGYTLANNVGIIDEDYRGNIKVALTNSTLKSTLIAGTRIAQLIPMQTINHTVVECSELKESDRGSGCFGSTGKK